MDVKAPSCLRHFIEDTPTQKSLWRHVETSMPQLQHIFTRCCGLGEGELQPRLMLDHYVPPHLSLGNAGLWPSRDHKERWWEWDVYQALQLHAWSYGSWIQTDNSSVVTEEETSRRAQKLPLLNVAWWGVVVEDLTTCPSAHRLSGWQPGMNAWLHCPCPCSLREVWNKQLWSDSSFQKCLWERRWKKPSEKQRCQAKCPSFPWPELSKPRYSL